MRSARPLLVALVVSTVPLGAVPLAHAAFADRTAASAAFSTAHVSPATGLSGSAGCLLLTPHVRLSWTATPTGFVTGYVVHRRLTSDTAFVRIGSVSGRSTTSYTDSTVTGGAKYVYAVDAVYASWTARSAEVQVSVPLLCL